MYFIERKKFIVEVGYRIVIYLFCLFYDDLCFENVEIVKKIILLMCIKFENVEIRNKIILLK